MKAVGYLRELPHASPVLALERQQRVFLLACADAGLEAGPVFTDVAEEPGQPEFRRLLRLAAREGQHGFTTLVVADVGVLGDTAREQWLRALQAGARGLALRLAIGGRAVGVRDVDAALVAAWRARAPEERRRERSLEGMRRRALRGEVLGRPPYGYRVVRVPAAESGPSGPRSRLAPDPLEAPIVERIFALYLESGEGVRRIAARLNADGVRTRRGAAWNVATVRALLRNPVYTGLYRRLGVTIPGAHRPLVSRADFGAVQRRLSARSTSRGGGRRHDYPLSGVARCGYCGSRLVGLSRASADGTPQRSYRCGAALNQGRCRARARRADDLEDEVLGSVAAGPEVAPPRAPLLPPAPPPADAGEEPRARALRRELDRLVERHAGGEWTLDDLQRRAGPIALELLALEERATQVAPGGDAARAGDTAAHGVAHADARRRLVVGWTDLDEAERRALLLEVVREVIVTDDDVRVALAP